MTYRLDKKLVGSVHVITSPDLPGLYVAHPDMAVADSQVSEAIAAIERINARAKERELLQHRYA